MGREDEALVKQAVLPGNHEREPKEKEIHNKEGLKARQKKKHGPKEAEKVISVTVYVYSKCWTAGRRLEEVSK